MNIFERFKSLVDLGLCVVIAAGSIYAYDEYKKHAEKIYVVDAQKIFQLKNQSINLSTATEDDIMKFYDSLQKMVEFSTRYINAVSATKNTLVYSKNIILTVNTNGKVIDLTDELIGKLKQEKFLP